MFLHQQQQEQQQCGNYWVDRRNVQTNPTPLNNTSYHDERNGDDYAYRDYSNVGGGPDNIVYYQTQYVNNNQARQPTNNFVNRNENIVNNNSFMSDHIDGEENVHKRKYDSIEEKYEIVEDEDEDPTIENEYSRDAKRVKKSLSSILSHLQVSDESLPQTDSTCTQLMCYDQNTNTPNLTLTINQPTIDQSMSDILHKKVLSSLMNPSKGTFIPDPRIDLKLQEPPKKEDDSEANQTAVVLYRDVIRRDEVLRRLNQGESNDISQNTMTDE